MKTSVLFAAAALTLFVAACTGDDDAPTPTRTPDYAPVGSARTERNEHDYFVALAGVLGQAQADMQALDDERSAAFDSDKGDLERTQAVSTLATDTAAKLEARRDAILNVKPQPPAALHTLHLALGSAADDQVTVALTVSDALADQPRTTEADYEALLTAQGADSAEERYQQACTALQDAADAAEIDADLHCSE